MVVLQFGFGGGAANPHRPENHVEQLVVYTGTHDTDTARGWWDGARCEGAGGDRSRSRRAGTGRCSSSRSARARTLAIVPAQDVLGLGSEARMNRPGIAEGNWGWRLEHGQLTPALARRLRAATRRERSLATAQTATGTVAPSALTESRGMWSLTFHSGAAARVAIGVFQVARVRSVIQSPALT